MRRVQRLLGLATLVVASTSCGDVVRQSRAPVNLYIDTLLAAQGNKPSTFSNFLTSDVLTLVTTPAPCTTNNPCPTIFNDIGQAQFHWDLKDQGTPTNATVPSRINQVILDRYRVDYIRADGRNVPGVDVPYGFDAAIAGTVQISATLTVSFELVRHVAKEESPLRQLVNSATVISTMARVTFYAHDVAGNQLSVTGNIQVNFGNFGD